jgi:hypothetical protein
LQIRIFTAESFIYSTKKWYIQQIVTKKSLKIPKGDPQEIKTIVKYQQLLALKKDYLR